MATTLTKNSTTGNITIATNGFPMVKLCNHGAIMVTHNDAGTHVIITTDNYSGHLLLSDITTIDGHTGGPFIMSDAMSHLDDLFKK